MECQVVVVGDAKVGKTALIRRLTQNEFFEVMTHRNLELTRANRSVDQYARCVVAAVQYHDNKGRASLLKSSFGRW